jgi:hypothetical protein
MPGLKDGFGLPGGAGKKSEAGKKQAWRIGIAVWPAMPDIAGPGGQVFFLFVKTIEPGPACQLYPEKGGGL